MIAALTATIVVLGFGAVTLKLVQNDLRAADQRLEQDEPSLHAELAASEGVARVLDGQEASFSGTGTVDGADYAYTITNNGDDTWTIVGRSGDGSRERTATSELRREVSSTVSGPEERFAVYGYELVDIGWVRGGDVAGPVASGERVRYWYSHSIGTRQDYVTTCDNCPNPQVNTSYVPLALPTPATPQACPVNGSYQLTGPVTLSGQYDCSAGGVTLSISGTVDVSGPVVIFVGDDTRLDIRNATINAGGDSADFVIAKPTASTWSYRSTIDDTTMHGRILAPESWMYVGDVTWRGTFEVETWWLYDWATIDGAWDGPVVPTDPSAVAFGTSYYTRGTPDLSWSAAQAEAQAAGGTLVQIDSAAENAFVLATFGDGERSIPIGLTDVASEGDWVTENGDPAPYTNWMSGEPNNAGNQDYARIASVTGEWDDGNVSEAAFRQTPTAGWTTTGSITVIEFENAVTASSTRTEWFLDGWQLD
ncbi:MAG: lectin-like protein [Actinomycetota bacterium]